MFEQLEQTSASYTLEANEIYKRLEVLYEIGQDYTTIDPEGLIAQLEGQWRYARQMAEDLYEAETASLDAIRLA